MSARRTKAAAAPAAYAVGYKKPPLETRFKKGNRANPRGRPRGSKNLMSLLAEALARRVTITEDGRPRRRAKRELGVARLADQFAAGDPQAVRVVLAMIADLERRLPPEPPARAPFDEADRMVIENVRARWRGS
jgi:hypothetical protein